MDALKKLWQYRALVCSKFMDALGVLMLLWAIIDIMVPEDDLSSGWRIGIIVLIVVASLIYALWKFFNHPASLDLEINKRTKLTIEKGDMFKASENAVCIIPVNEYFDTHLGDGIIQENSVHGAFLRMYKDRIPELRLAIDKELEGQQALPKNRTRTMVAGLPQKRYPLGTCVRFMEGGRIFILVAVTRFNKDEHVDVSAEEYPEVIRKMYNGIENLHNGNAVYMPLVGGGISGYQLEKMQLLMSMVQAAHNANTLSIVNGMYICIYKEEEWQSINLNVIEYLYNRWKTLK